MGLIHGQPIRCKNDHIIGVADGGRLFVFRQAVHAPNGKGALSWLDEKGLTALAAQIVVEMQHGVVICSLCGSGRRWIGEEKKAFLIDQIDFGDHKFILGFPTIEVDGLPKGEVKVGQGIFHFYLGDDDETD